LAKIHNPVKALTSAEIERPDDDRRRRRNMHPGEEQADEIVAA
jgi:hypothetical protein